MLRKGRIEEATLPEIVLLLTRELAYLWREKMSFVEGSDKESNILYIIIM